MSAVVEAGIDGRYVEANDEGLALFGCTREEFLASRIGDFSGPHAMLALSIWRRLASTAAAIPTGESTIYRRDGSSLRVHYTRITRLEDRYELELVAVNGGEAPPVADHPADVLRQWRSAERDAESGGVDGAISAAESLRELYHSSVAGRQREAAEDPGKA